MTCHKTSSFSSPRALSYLGSLSSVRALALATATLLSACAGDPTIQTGDDAETIMDGRLARVDNARASLVYVDPDFDYGRFDAVMIDPLDVEHIEVIQPSSSSSSINRFNREWELTDKDKESLRSNFSEAVKGAISSRGAFELTDEADHNVVRIAALITQIAPTGPRDDVQSRGVRSTVITDGAGSISVAMMITDSTSGEVLAIIKDTRDGESNFGTINNRVTNIAELRRHFNAWGRQLSDGLVALQQRSAKTP
jgi:hypothetical protein